MALGPIEISLSAAAGKRTRNNDLRLGCCTGSSLVVVADEKSELIDPFRREQMAVADIDFMFHRHGAVASFGQGRAAYVLISKD